MKTKTSEEDILKMIIEKESWEEIIYYIVSVEKLDPWNIDLVKLAEGFVRYIKMVEYLDFRIPAKVVFVAAILLKLKASYLTIFEEVEEEEEKEKKYEELGIEPELVELGIPLRRIPKRQITLEELIYALRKALKVKERREERRKRWERRLGAEIVGEEDISKRIERLLREIEEVMERLKERKVRFREIVEEWKRDRIVEHLVPLLHLEKDKKVKTEQEKFFDEIWITKPQ